jgi:hypothetical protein
LRGVTEGVVSVRPVEVVGREVVIDVVTGTLAAVEEGPIEEGGDTAAGGSADAEQAATTMPTPTSHPLLARFCSGI